MYVGIACSEACFSFFFLSFPFFYHVACVMKKFPSVTANNIRAVITNKLSNEVKLRKKKAKDQERYM